MKFSERWLREWVNPAIEADRLMHLLTMAGLEIEAVAPAAFSLTNVVVGEVQSVSRHPDADKLNVCSVSDGTTQFQVVCGAANVRPGLRVPFARIGARLGDDLSIKRAKLRGVESQGMLCSAAELGMAESADGLLELPADAPVGQNIAEYLQLDDSLIEVNLTPNRGDCLSIAGLAREVGVVTRAAVAGPANSSIAVTVPDRKAVRLDAGADCPRYLGRVIRNVRTDAETPLWMQEKLRRCGLRCIEPVVDVTNYVLLELGQPMHAFDFNKLHGDITVRRAKPAERITLLDGKDVELDSEILVIADQNGAVAMAGVMGGKATAVGPMTTDIFLESAFFSPLAIAGRARRFGMHTDAGHRYERGVDFNLPALAMERATSLLLDIVGGQAGPVTVAETEVSEIAPLRLRRARIQRLLGTAIDDAAVEDILGRLGLVLQQRTADGWIWQVPSWRFDIRIEADLIEELARISGYDALPVTTPAARLPLRQQVESRLGLRKLRARLTSLGYQEVVTYSFVDAELEAALGEGSKAAVLANPISQDLAVMRTSLWPGLIKTLKHNQNRQVTRLRCFESGLVFINKNSELRQNIKVGSILWGAPAAEQWGSAASAADFFDLKGDVEELLALTGARDEFEFVEDVHQALQPGQTARIDRMGQLVGWIGALHPLLQQALDIPGKVFLAELDFDLLRRARLPEARELSRFPQVRRDLAVVVAEDIAAQAVMDSLRKNAGESLIDVVLFDVYQGENIGRGKKSLALGLTFQHASRTLADEDINPIIDSCIKALEAKFNAELR